MMELRGKIELTQLQGKIALIPTDSQPVLQEKTAKENGEVTADAGYDGLSKVTVAVPEPTGVQTITKNGTYDVTDDASAIVNVPVPEGYVKPSGTKSIASNGTHVISGYANAEVNVPNTIPEGYIKPSGTKSVTTNGTHDVTSYASVDVNVPSTGGGEAVLQDKTFTENGEYTADEGYDGFGTVTIAVPNNGSVVSTDAEYVLYNGIGFPNIEKVWTDKETYPYATIEITLGMTILLLTSEPVKYNSGSYLVKDTAYSVHVNLYGSWVHSNDGVSTSDKNYSSGSTIIWSSVDVLNLKGSVYLETSNPVVINGTDTAEYMLYGGEELPNIDSIWNKDTYPYAVIQKIDASSIVPSLSGECYMAYFFASPLGSTVNSAGNGVYSVDASLKTEFTCEDYVLTFDSSLADAVGIDVGVWAYDGSSATNTWVPELGTIWTSYDVLKFSDNTVLYAASTPKPVTGKGSSVVVWYAGQEYPTLEGEGSAIKISDLTPTAQELRSSLVTILADSIGVSFPVKAVDYFGMTLILKPEAPEEWTDEDMAAIIIPPALAEGLAGDASLAGTYLSPEIIGSDLISIWLCWDPNAPIVNEET